MTGIGFAGIIVIDDGATTVRSMPFVEKVTQSAEKVLCKKKIKKGPSAT